MSTSAQEVAQEMDAATKAEIAHGVSERLKPENAWTRKAWARDGEGCQVGFEHIDKATCLCLGGAIKVTSAQVLREDILSIDVHIGPIAYEYAQELAGRGWPIEAPNPNETLALCRWMHTVITWNDAKGRTAHEVRELATAVRLRLAHASASDTVG